MYRGPLKVRGFLVLALALVPLTASAHLVSTGLGPVYDGAVHFAINPAEVLSVGALALFAGRRGKADARLVLFLFPLAWLAVAPLPAVLPMRQQDFLTAVILLINGGILAADVSLGRVATAVIAVVEGFVLGCVNERSASITLGFPMLIGVLMTVFAQIALLASIAVSLRRSRAVLALRVGGSWVAAFGLLLAGWAWRFPQ